jgi:hypothetical protein
VSLSPFEGFLLKNPGKDLDKLEIKLKDKDCFKLQAVLGLPHRLLGYSRRQKIQKLPPEEIQAYQVDKMGQVLLGMELHVAEICRLFCKPRNGLLDTGSAWHRGFASPAEHSDELLRCRGQLYE